MTVSIEIEKLKENLSNAYTVVSIKNGTIPQDKNFDNLSAAINTIVSGEQVEQIVSLEIDNINGEIV